MSLLKRRNRLKRDDKVRKRYTPDQVMDMLHDFSVSIMQMENIIHMVDHHPHFVEVSRDNSIMRMATKLFKSNIRNVLERGDYQTEDKWECECPENCTHEWVEDVVKCGLICRKCYLVKRKEDPA